MVGQFHVLITKGIFQLWCWEGFCRFRHWCWKWFYLRMIEFDVFRFCRCTSSHLKMHVHSFLWYSSIYFVVAHLYVLFIVSWGFVDEFFEVLSISLWGPVNKYYKVLFNRFLRFCSYVSWHCPDTYYEVLIKRFFTPCSTASTDCPNRFVNQKP